MPTNDANSVRKLEDAVDQLELAWLAGSADLSSVCSLDGLSNADRYELALVDMECRWRRNQSGDLHHEKNLGPRPTWHDYCRCWPEWFGANDLTPELIAEAYRIQKRHGATQAKDEILARHRHLLADLLKPLATVDRDMRADGLTSEFQASIERVRIDSAQAPLRFDDYVLEKHLGSGGMGKVYRATQRSLNRPVAIKTLRKRWQGDGEATRRLVQEARLLGMLRHPGIVSVHGLGQFPGGSVFLAMDYIDGTNLNRFCAHERLPDNQILDIVRSIADAVAHAHDRQVLHCDLKPSNILLDQNNRVYVTDFGLGRALGNSAATGSGGEGTPAFMAPEQFMPDDRITKATDVYGIGGILYTLLHQHLPGDQDQFLEDREVAATDLERICGKCLAAAPQDRFDDARKLHEALL